MDEARPLATLADLSSYFSRSELSDVSRRSGKCANYVSRIAERRIAFVLR